MSGLDPLAALAAQAAESQSLVQEAALNLGDLLDAVVLPPQNGVDRISVFGQTVAAQLPPGINPGDSIVLQVTGFQGQQIYVRNLGPADPENRAQTVSVPTTQPENSDSPTSVVLTNRPPVTPQPRTIASQTSGSNVAPPREIFVAASVRPQNAPAIQQQLARDAVAASAGDEVELRLAVNRTAINPALSRLVNETDATPSHTAQPTPPRVTPQIPPPLLGKQPVTIAKNPVVVTPQSQLLARLRVPISSSTLVAARLIDDAARHLTSSYQRLDQMLSKLPGTDPRIGSLRSLLSFVGKLDLRNTQALPEQIASFVSHVVGGAENKVAQIVRALTAAAAEATQPEEQNATQTLPESRVPSSASPVQTLGVPPELQTPAQSLLAVTHSAELPPAVAARVAERTVALDHDVKTAIMSLVQSPPREMTPAGTQALSSALGATTALQLNVLLSQNNDPSTIAIPLPAYFYDGGKPAHIAISRDKPNGGAPMDGDNFHVSFVLDTKTMGTVAIDLQTVGRAVSVNVKTERTSTASRFRESLSDLRTRLEQLRYRVASMAADVAPPRGAKADASVSPSPVRRSKSNVDMRA